MATLAEQGSGGMQLFVHGWFYKFARGKGSWVSRCSEERDFHEIDRIALNKVKVLLAIGQRKRRPSGENS